MKFLKQIGFNYLLIIALAQLVFRYGFLDKFSPILALNDWQYALMILATLLVAAGGFFVTNAMAQEPRMPEGKLYNIYGAFTLVGFGIAYYLCDTVHKPLVIAAFIIGAATMYLYATSLKQVIIVSNLMVAFTAILPVIIIALLNMYPILVPETQEAFALLFDKMLDYSIFLFVVVLVLTFVYNLRDTDKDYNSGNNTLPIAIGRDRAAKVTFVIALVPLIMLFYYGDKYLLEYTFALGYGLLLIAAPLIYFLIKLWSAKTTKDFHHLIQVVKIVLFFTILSIVVITYEVNANNIIDA